MQSVVCCVVRFGMECFVGIKRAVRPHAFEIGGLCM